MAAADVDTEDEVYDGEINRFVVAKISNKEHFDPRAKSPTNIDLGDVESDLRSLVFERHKDNIVENTALEKFLRENGMDAGGTTGKDDDDAAAGSVFDVDKMMANAGLGVINEHETESDDDQQSEFQKQFYKQMEAARTSRVISPKQGWGGSNGGRENTPKSKQSSRSSRSGSYSRPRQREEEEEDDEDEENDQNNFFSNQLKRIRRNSEASSVARRSVAVNSPIAAPEYTHHKRPSSSTSQLSRPRSEPSPKPKPRTQRSGHSQRRHHDDDDRSNSDEDSGESEMDSSDDERDARTRRRENKKARRLREKHQLITQLNEIVEMSKPVQVMSKPINERFSTKDSLMYLRAEWNIYRSNMDSRRNIAMGKSAAVVLVALVVWLNSKKGFLKLGSNRAKDPDFFTIFLHNLNLPENAMMLKQMGSRMFTSMNRSPFLSFVVITIMSVVFVHIRNTTGFDLASFLGVQVPGGAAQTGFGSTAPMAGDKQSSGGGGDDGGGGGSNSTGMESVMPALMQMAGQFLPQIGAMLGGGGGGGVAGSDISQNADRIVGIQAPAMDDDDDS